MQRQPRCSEHGLKRICFSSKRSPDERSDIRGCGGATCEATFGSFGGANLTFKRLLLVTPPARGKIKLREGGYYIYTAHSSQGSDKFTLRVCGSQNNSPGCATLNYSVTVK